MALSSFYSWKEKSTNPKRPTGITYNQKIRRFRDFIPLARKYLAVLKVSSTASRQSGACCGIGLPSKELAQ